jgi:hypothetical protein
MGQPTTNKAFMTWGVKTINLGKSGRAVGPYFCYQCVHDTFILPLPSFPPTPSFSPPYLSFYCSPPPPIIMMEETAPPPAKKQATIETETAPFQSVNSAFSSVLVPSPSTQFGLLYTVFHVQIQIDCHVQKCHFVLTEETNGLQKYKTHFGIINRKCVKFDTSFNYLVKIFNFRFRFLLDKCVNDYKYVTYKLDLIANKAHFSVDNAIDGVQMWGRQWDLSQIVFGTKNIDFTGKIFVYRKISSAERSPAAVTTSVTSTLSIL